VHIKSPRAVVGIRQFNVEEFGTEQRTPSLADVYVNFDSKR